MSGQIQVFSDKVRFEDHFDRVRFMVSEKTDDIVEIETLMLHYILKHIEQFKNAGTDGTDFTFSATRSDLQYLLKKQLRVCYELFYRKEKRYGK